MNIKFFGRKKPKDVCDPARTETPLGKCGFAGRRFHWRRQALRKAACAACITVLLAGTAGCDAAESVSSIQEENVFTIGSRKCALTDAKMILVDFQKEYDSLYGIDMWDHDYGEEMSLEEYIKELAITQLAEVYTLCVIADEEEIALTEEETETAALAAAEFFSSLTEDETEYMGIDEADAADLFEKYLLAQKAYSYITESVDSEISDSEARVMTAVYMVFSDSESAESAQAAVCEDTSDIESLALLYSESSDIEINIDRSTFGDDMTEALFALSEGEVSGVLTEDGLYYVFYCVSAFDETLTDENKEVILSQRKEEAAQAEYESYASSLNSSLDEELWDEVSVDAELELSDVSFLDIFESYFGS